MFRLAHISDLHLAPLPAPTWRELASKRILGYLNWQKNRKKTLGDRFLVPLLTHLKEQLPDHTVINGDIVNLALEKEYTSAAQFLEWFGAPNNTMAVCGNHDAYIASGMEHAIHHWAPYMSGDDALITSVDEYPVVRVRDDVAIIGCNSAEATLPFLATGYFRKKQADRLASILRETEGLCRIVCIHHPPHKHATKHHKRLIGQRRFRKVIAQCGAELILHGHTHLDTHRTIPGPKASVPIICVPAAGNAPGGSRPAGHYNLFEIEKEENSWNITQQKWGWDAAGMNVVLIGSVSL